jgi:DmsE family decaheme c-type cytochrome
MASSNILRKYAVWTFATIVSFWSMQAVAADKAGKPAQQSNTPKAQSVVSGATYVGSEQCKQCHENQFNNVKGTKHYLALGVGGEKAGKDVHGCESCHGAGSAHVEAGGDKTKIFNFKDATSDQKTAQCMQCHANNQDHQNFQNSKHNRAGVTCTSCHVVHGPKPEAGQLIQKDPGLCFSCHSKEKSAFAKPFHHRVPEGLVKCSDCHNPHGGNGEHQLRSAASQDAVCFQCHSEKRGPFAFEHAPVKTEGCSACHTPHGSNNPRLLTRARVNTLCIGCHSALPSGMSSGNNHSQNTARQNCIACHSQIHGSNANNRFFK